MFVVIFEVQPKAEKWDAYLAQAKALKPILEGMDGFIDNDRFASQRIEGRLLSLSTWADEKALVRWRTQARHHEAQEAGRFALFADYHLRVGEITADSGPPDGHALRDERLDVTEAGAAKVVTISVLEPVDGKPAVPPEGLAAALGVPATGTAGVVDCEVYESIYTPGRLALLVSWQDDTAAQAWQPGAPAGPAPRHRRVRVLRDYGMHDRREAPQYYPPVER